MTDAVPFASGREADLYAVDAHRVLRRYRHGGDTSAETAAMSYAAGHGYPVPIVYESHGADMILERLPGPTMLGALLAADLTPDAGAALLAGLLHRLHALPPRATAGPDDRLVHLDLHPDNVMLTHRGPVVIDWRNATDGPPDLDVALSALILAQAAVDPTSVHARVADAFLTAFLRAAPGDPLRLLDRAVALRRTQLGGAPALAAAAERILRSR